jgi:hypothetical protein
MALSGETNKTTFTTVGGETSFVFQIPFFDATTVTATKYGDIKVTRERSGVVNLVLTPSTTPTTQTEFKLLATNGDPSQGGTVTLGAGATAGDKYVIERDVAYTQQYDLQDGATIDPTALNKAFDRVVAQNQQQNDLLTRTVEFPVTDNTSRTYTVGTETERANKALGFDASGNVTEIDLVSSGAVSGNTNAGISISNNIISAKVDGATTEFSGGNIAVKDSGITAAKLAADSVTTAKIASTTGTDSNVVTGTKGTNGKIVIWDANGDAIDSGYTITNDDSLGTSDATLSTQGNIKSYVDSKSVLRSLFIYQSTGQTTISSSSNTTCPLTQSFSDDSSMSVSANIITLTAGTYLVKADANIGMDNNNVSNFVQGAIVDTGNSDSVLIAGKLLHSYNDYSLDTTHDFSCISKLTLGSTTTMALKFRTNSTAQTGSTIGKSGSITGLGTPIHATVYIEKIT